MCIYICMYIYIYIYIYIYYTYIINYTIVKFENGGAFKKWQSTCSTNKFIALPLYSLTMKTYNWTSKLSVSCLMTDLSLKNIYFFQ